MSKPEAPPWTVKENFRTNATTWVEVENEPIQSSVHSDYLGFIVRHRGMEIGKNKSREITEAPLLKNKKELQRLIGQMNLFRLSLSNLAGKLPPLSLCCVNNFILIDSINPWYSPL